MRCGIEFEYLLLDLAGSEPGRLRDFTNLSFETLAPLLEDKPGRDDPQLASGDIGIRSGYWYLEGDERADEDGRFRTLVVKGVEIRTPPKDSVEGAVHSLLAIEAELIQVLARHGLALGIVGFNPLRPRYEFDPPLNDWERAERASDHSYDGTHISTLSYGPDINLSHPDWTPAHCLDVARKLNFYAPYIVPFSFSSPFYAGGLWRGPSKRTYERAAHRPAVKVYLEPGTTLPSPLLSPPRLPTESGRIEFKAFDAITDLNLLIACCSLLEGLCLAQDLPGRSETADLELYRRAALNGFEDEPIRQGSASLLLAARQALRLAGRMRALQALAPLECFLNTRRTPAQTLRQTFQATGALWRSGGIADSR